MTDRFFLGGRDLEMAEIRRLLIDAGWEEHIVDRGLAWGARASAYLDEIRAALGDGDTPVLVELLDDLPADVPRQRLVMIDHHGARAGADAPSALRQVFLRLPLGTRPLWTRQMELVEANDIAHAAGLRSRGATPEEVRTIRDADRAAQGVTAEIEAESRRAISQRRHAGALTVVDTSAPTASAIVDFLLTEYSGPGAGEVLVHMPGKSAFFGSGRVVRALAAAVPGSWFGGALPARGYWGANVAAHAHADIEALARATADGPEDSPGGDRRGLPPSPASGRR